MVDNNIKVSIIIPVYNVQEYVSECIQSAIKQTYKNIEIIIINDGSTDNSREIIKPFLSDKRIYYYEQENRGLSIARNVGINNSSGDYLYFLDSDDFIDLNTIELCVNKINDFNKPDMIIFNAQIRLENKIDKTIENYDRGDVLDCNTIYSGDFVLLELLKKNKYKSSVCLNLYQKEFLIINKLYFQEGLIFEDELHTFNSLLNAKSLIYIPNKLFNRRVRENSLMTTKFSQKKFYSLLYVIEEIDKKNININNAELKQLIDERLKIMYLKLLKYTITKKALRNSRRTLVKSLFLRNKVKMRIITIFPYIYFGIRKIKRLVAK